MAAWLRLGKIAACVVLAGLAVAGGLAFPGAQDAAAYDGYTYTERLCQEYGQQPRRYQVRDPIPGSDWRNDGGWAIVLIRSANVRRAEYTFSALSNDDNDFNSQALAAGGDAAQALQNVLNGWAGGNQQMVGADDNGVWESSFFWFIRSGTLIVAQDGTQGFVTTQYYGRAVVVDRNNNGVLDAGDMATASQLLKSFPGNNLYADKRTVTRVVDPVNYGAQYVRWANLAWCR